MAWNQELENIIFVTTVILAVFFTLIGYYLQTVLRYDKNLNIKDCVKGDTSGDNNCAKCARNIEVSDNYRVFLKTFKVDLPKALIIGCYVISASFILNCILNINDIFLSIKKKKKVFVWGMFTYILLTITHLTILFKKISKCVSEGCKSEKSDCNIPENEITNYFNFVLKPDIISKINTSSFVLLGVCAGLMLLMILPTYLAKSKNIRKR